MNTLRDPKTAAVLDRLFGSARGDAIQFLKLIPRFAAGIATGKKLWEILCGPVLEMLKPKLRPGALVVSDNIHTFRKTLAPYEAYVTDGRNGFESVTLSLTSGLAVSVRT